MNIRTTTASRKDKFIYPALLFSSLCLLIPAFYNHYPLVNPDTGTYISSGFIPEMPSDRPITYGLLIRLFTLNGISLWLLAFAQAYIVSWLIFRILKNLSDGDSYILKSLLIVFFLSVGSSLSWIVSQVQPDFLTAIAFLCIIILLMNKERRRINVLLYCLFFFAVAAHFSHPLLMIVSLVFLFTCRRVYAGRTDAEPKKRIGALIILSLCGILVMLTPLHKSKHIFIIGSLLEKGVLVKYLDDNCSVKNYKICKYMDALPSNSDLFIWDTGSPLNKIGSWKSVKPEFNEIISDIFTRPKYLKLYIVSTARQTLQQAISFNIGDGNQSFPPGSYVSKNISEYFPREANRFNHAWQNQASVLELLSVPNKLFTIVLICSLAALVYVFMKWRHLPGEMRLVLIVCIPAVFLNCLDCAAFGIVNGRYGCKMIWLIPFCVLAFCASKKLSGPKGQYGTK